MTPRLRPRASRSAAAEARAFTRFTAVLRRLRAPRGGCPWDRKQTPETLRHLLLEEAYEAVEAATDPELARGELGDLLLVLLMIALIHEEKKKFTVADVCDAIREKIVRRHPHVFGAVKVKDADEVLANWSQIKSREKKQTGSIVANLPKALPALLKARRLDERFEQLGLPAPVRPRRGRRRLTRSELATTLYALVQDARRQKLDAELELGRYCNRLIAAAEKQHRRTAHKP